MLILAHGHRPVCRTKSQKQTGPFIICTGGFELHFDPPPVALNLFKICTLNFTLNNNKKNSKMNT